MNFIRPWRLTSRIAADFESKDRARRPAQALVRTAPLTVGARWPGCACSGSSAHPSSPRPPRASGGRTIRRATYRSSYSKYEVPYRRRRRQRGARPISRLYLACISPVSRRQRGELPPSQPLSQPPSRASLLTRALHRLVLGGLAALRLVRVRDRVRVRVGGIKVGVRVRVRARRPPPG